MYQELELTAFDSEKSKNHRIVTAVLKTLH